jgi:acetolactate synthase-1/2/3 large subunit
LTSATIDADQPSKNYPAELRIHANARPALRTVFDGIGAGGTKHGSWTDDARTARAKVRTELAERGSLEWQLLHAIREAIPRDTSVGCDPHLLSYWAWQHFPIYEPRAGL